MKRTWKVLKTDGSLCTKLSLFLKENENSGEFFSQTVISVYLPKALWFYLLTFYLMFRLNGIPSSSSRRIFLQIFNHLSVGSSSFALLIWKIVAGIPRTHFQQFSSRLLSFLQNLRRCNIEMLLVSRFEVSFIKFQQLLTVAEWIVIVILKSGLSSPTLQLESSKEM